MSETKFDTLYKKSSKGKVSEWTISVVENEDNHGVITVVRGYTGGAMQTDVKVIKKGKNQGKANATNPYEQAVSQAESMRNKQIDKGYVLLDEVDKVYVLPMLAHSYDKKKKNVKFPWLGQPKFDGCLHYDSLVELKGIGKVKIGEVVEGKYNGLIKSYNTKSNRVEYKEITNVFVNGVDKNENSYQWYEIETESGKNIRITGNHRVWLPELGCYRRVDQLNGDESFLIDFRK